MEDRGAFVLGFSGFSGSGKTNLIEGLVQRSVSRGLRDGGMSGRAVALLLHKLC